MADAPHCVSCTCNVHPSRSLGPRYRLKPDRPGDKYEQITIVIVHAMNETHVQYGFGSNGRGMLTTLPREAFDRMYEPLDKAVDTVLTYRG